MKSESQIRRNIKLAKNRYDAAEEGSKEKSVALAVSMVLGWVVNKSGFDADSVIIDASIEDYSDKGEPREGLPSPF